MALFRQTSLTLNYTEYHQLYAGIHFTFTHLTDVDLKIETEVLMCDNLKIRLYKAPQIEELNPAEVKEVSTVGDAAEHKLPAFQASQSSEADSDEWMKRRNHASISGGGSTQRPPPPPFESAMVDIEGINLRITVSEKQAVVTTRLRKFGCDENALVVREDITLQVDFNKNLSTTFRNWVEILTKFINCFCPKWRTVYFLESSSTECKRKGFELVRSIPPLGKYNFCAGNYFIDVNEL
ncbi:GL21047 [Drosophila persimilis]|uniref:GL21047 n=1 Tax=Drosophila persimilis TaxID=7234 RepID=B4GX77_DROPE|nr:GL21047 [Drosophila persimilis]